MYQVQLFVKCIIDVLDMICGVRTHNKFDSDVPYIIRKQIFWLQMGGICLVSENKK
jgi:hypothetical protein